MQLDEGSTVSPSSLWVHGPLHPEVLLSSADTILDTGGSSDIGCSSRASLVSPELRDAERGPYLV